MVPSDAPEAHQSPDIDNSLENVVLQDTYGELSAFRPKYDDAFRQLLADMIQQGLPTQQIVRELRVAPVTVKRYRRRISAFGTHRPASISVKGQPRKLSAAIQEDILTFIKDQPQAPYLDEIQLFLQDQHDITVNISTISRTLKRLNWSYKKGDRVHPDRDDEQRARFRARICDYRASQLVVVDESGINPRTGDRQWGFSPCGVAYKMTQTGKKSKNLSILPALGINGYLDYELYQGSFDSERFANFIRRLVLRMTPYPGPRSVLILDNCSIHHSELVRQICIDNGVRFEPLPAYSPDFSPIELTFSILKSWVRRNRGLLDTQPELRSNFYEFIHMAISASDIKEQARELFRRCHYTVDDDDDDVCYDELAILE